VVRVEHLEDAWEFIPNVLDRVKREYLEKTYKIEGWTDSEDFLTKMAK